MRSVPPVRSPRLLPPPPPRLPLRTARALDHRRARCRDGDSNFNTLSERYPTSPRNLSVTNMTEPQSRAGEIASSPACRRDVFSPNLPRAWPLRLGPQLTAPVPLVSQASISCCDRSRGRHRGRHQRVRRRRVHHRRVRRGRRQHGAAVVTTVLLVLVLWTSSSARSTCPSRSLDARVYPSPPRAARRACLCRAPPRPPIARLAGALLRALERGRAAGPTRWPRCMDPHCRDLCLLRGPHCMDPCPPCKYLMRS